MRLVCSAELNIKHGLTCVDRGLHGDTSEQVGHARQEHLTTLVHRNRTLSLHCSCITIDIPMLYNMNRYNTPKVQCAEQTIEQSPGTPTRRQAR